MIYAFEDFTIDTDRFQLVGPDGSVEAEPQALEFLIHMIRNRGHLVTKEALHQTFWPDRVVSDAALSNLVRNARRLVGDSGDEQRIIATRHGRGFVFRAEVREIASPEAPVDAKRGPSGQVTPRVEGAPTIMVLPFEIVGAAADASGLGEGVTEEVMAALARSRWFPMIARNRVRTFLEFPPEERGPYRKLGASYIVEGGLLFEGEDVRLHLQLTDTRPALHLHVSRHELRYRGLFGLLDEIATIVSATIQPELLEAERVKAERTDPDARSAWQEFVLGQYLIAAPDKAGNDTARAHFERALDLEPGSGRIHAGLAMTHLWDYKYDWSDSAELSLGAAARDAERALRLAPDDSWAWSILAICKLSLGRSEDALADARRAIETDPSSAMAHGCSCWVLAYSGRFADALEAFDRAMALSPRDRRRGLWITGRAVAQFGLDDFEGALRSARDLVALSPDHPSGHRMKCASLVRLGRLVEARRAADVLTGILPDHDVDEAISRQPFSPELGQAYADALKQAGLTGRGSLAANPARSAVLPAAKPDRVNYTTTRDGFRIAWTEIGSGRPLFAALGWMSNIDVASGNPFWGPLIDRLSRDHRVILFDHRGMGASDREVGEYTFEDLVADMQAVVQASGLETFPVIAMSQGCAVTLELMRRCPGRVTRLVMYAPFATGWRRPEWGAATAINEAVVGISKLGWEGNDWPFSRIVTEHILNGASREETEWIETFIKSTISGPNGARLVEAMADFDLSGDLCDLAIPTMVLHSEGDIAVPSAHSRAVADAIPGAIHIEVPSQHHVPMAATSPWRDAMRAVTAFLNQ